MAIDVLEAIVGMDNGGLSRSTYRNFFLANNDTRVCASQTKACKPGLFDCFKGVFCQSRTTNTHAR